MKMQTLQSRVVALKRNTQIVADVTVERIRGHALQRRNKRFLARNPLCTHCLQRNLVTAAAECDHVVPLWKGGDDDERNLQGLCIEHHHIKSAREQAERMSIA